jgi:hypothetical protein
VKEDFQASEGVSAFDKTEHTSNLSHLDFDPSAPCPLHPTGHHKWGKCSHNPVNVQHMNRGILTFSPTPFCDDAEADNNYISAMDDQAELLRWHCFLGHILFNHLEQLVLIGEIEIPKRLATVKQPKCAGFLKYGGTPTAAASQSAGIEDSMRPIGTRSVSSNAASDIPDEISFLDDMSKQPDDVMAPSTSVPGDTQVSEGASASVPPSTSLGTRSRGRPRTMSRAMKDLVSPWSFYGDSKIHYMRAMHAVMSEEAEYRLFPTEHDYHLGLQDCMPHPIGFHAEMMGDIMYFPQQSMTQPDAKEFVEAVVKEVNGHMETYQA